MFLLGLVGELYENSGKIAVLGSFHEKLWKEDGIQFLEMKETLTKL